MANDFYNASGWPAVRQAGTSAPARNELSLIAQGFDKFPVLTGNALKVWRVNAGGTAIEAVSSLSLTDLTLTGNLSVEGNTTLGNAAGDTLTINPSAVTWSNNPTHSGNHTFSGNVTIGGNATIGDAAGDTLTIAPNAVTWSGNPTHSGNHTFSGNVTINGNTLIGNQAADTLTIEPNAVTWSGNPTHSGNHTFSGNVTIGGAVVLGDAAGDALTIAGSAVTWSNNPTHSGNHAFSGNVTVGGNTTLGNAAGDVTTITGVFEPGADNTYSVGSATKRWAAVCGAIFREGGATTNFINTSGTQTRINTGSTWQSLALYTNGSERVTINASGEIGVAGAAAAGVKLNVAGLSQTTELFLLNAGTSGSLGTTPALYSPASGVLGISAGGAERVRISTGTTFYNGATELFGILGDGRVYGKYLHNNASAVTGTSDQWIASGTYTPTATSVLNIASSSPGVFQWMRVGNVVTVSGRTLIAPTAAGATITALELSLPIASALSDTSQLAGTASDGDSNGPGSVVGALVGDRAQIVFLANSTNNRAWFVHFTYVIV
jgi:hypothetical protein